MIKEELQNYLRQFEPLKNCTVGYKNRAQEMLAPYLVQVSGAINVNDQYMAYETEVNLLEFGSGHDLERFVKVLLKSFDEAAKNRLPIMAPQR
jgi:hypothetical protein